MYIIWCCLRNSCIHTCIYIFEKIWDIYINTYIQIIYMHTHIFVYPYFMVFHATTITVLMPDLASLFPTNTPELYTLMFLENWKISPWSIRRRKIHRNTEIQKCHISNYANEQLILVKSHDSYPPKSSQDNIAHMTANVRENTSPIWQSICQCGCISSSDFPLYEMPNSKACTIFCNNTLRPRQNDRQFCRYLQSLNATYCIFISILHRLFSLGSG